MKYSDQIANWLVELGYTHFFCVGGGNIMHLTESLNRKLICIPVVNEVAAGIAAEYFNKTSKKNKKALALVTAGPGLTNIITAIAGAFLESRELLVIGGQVKTQDLSFGKIRQRGIQEIDGVSITKPITINSKIMLEPWDRNTFSNFTQQEDITRKGPIFIEIPLDIQALNVKFKKRLINNKKNYNKKIKKNDLQKVVKLLKLSSRPVILIGGGVSKKTISKIYKKIKLTSIPFMTTYNGMDRIGSNHPNYFGVPNIWGQRSSNILIQQSDILLALGTRLGLQQTGFNWKGFVPNGKIIHIDIDNRELTKGHPKIFMGLAVDANDLLEKILKKNLGKHQKWLKFCRTVRGIIPRIEKNANKRYKGYVSPYDFLKKLSKISKKNDIIIPCSSGGAFTLTHQIFEQKKGQIIVSNKSLAAMGYGLSGAIGASIANPRNKVILIEGDGGFAQNLQEIGTAKINKCNLKIFIYDDKGYASIRMTQRSYFKGKYVGCDVSTGLGLPKWESLFKAWGVKVIKIDSRNFKKKNFSKEFNSTGLVVYIVKVAPEQTYFPKISSKISKTEGMISNPIHLMSPSLNNKIKDKVFKYF